jgi:cyclomaltodextrinase
MKDVVDFFFSPYVTAQERRRQAALRAGLAHGSQMEPRDPAPDEPVEVFFMAQAGLPIDRLAVYYTSDGSLPAGERGVATCGAVVFAEPGELVEDAALGAPIRRWRARLPGQPEGALVRYCADAWSLENPHLCWRADEVEPVGPPLEDGRCFAYSVDRFQPPDWLQDAVIYHIFVDRFHAASDEPPMCDPGSITGFFGGTLRGVLEKLDYLAGLGVNCLWLSPVFASPTHHGYNPSDYYTVAARYGTNETLRHLIDCAHQRGMRVVLDFVANHTSDEHPLFLEARTNPASESARWYSFGDWPPHGYRSYALVGTMPELATERANVQQYLIEAALHWLGHFGADGLRLDYVSGPSPTFWAIFQREIKRRFPQALTLGEISEPLPELATYAGRMDAFLAFPQARMLRRVFAQRQEPLAALLAFLDERVALLPTGMGCATVLDNHDMHRFLWLAGGDVARLKLAVACQMTLDGAPILYYGTEVGLSQSGDAHEENAYARAPMLWGEQQDQELLAYYRQLIALRHAHPALRGAGRLTLAALARDASAEVQEQVGAYLRWEGQDAVLVVINNAEEPVRLQVALAGEMPGYLQPGGQAPVFTPAVLSAESSWMQTDAGHLEVRLPTMSAAVFVAVPAVVAKES